MLTIAGLTLKETLRRRAPIISFLIAGLLPVGAFIPLSGRLLLLPRPEANRIFAAFYVLLSTDIVKFFASVFSITLAAGAIGAEIERGVLLSLLPKPLSRFSVYAGKWLGLFAFVALNVVLWLAVIWAVAEYRAPHLSHRRVWTALPYVLVYPAMFSSLALLFSTFSSFALAGGLATLFTGIGWAEGILMFLFRAFDVDVLRTLARVAGFLVPLGRMSRTVTLALGPLRVTFPDGRTVNINDTGPITPQGWDLHYVLGYIVVLFVAGAVVLGRRDV